MIRILVGYLFLFMIVLGTRNVRVDLRRLGAWSMMRYLSSEQRRHRDNALWSSIADVVLMLVGVIGLIVVVVGLFL